MDTTIRPACLSDIPYLYEICLKTGDSGKDASALYSDTWLIGQYYAAPYLFHDPSLCFIAEMNRVPKGYIISTADTLAFNIWLDAVWLPLLRERYPLTLLEGGNLSTNERGVISAIHERHAERPAAPWFEQYPAHLHIDLLPDLQGKGCGRALVETLLNKHKSRGCRGIHLGVDGRNTGAISFYRKMGFVELEEKDWGMFMGKELTR
jgi:ribosomal protein S18 acetylase RimI-like enzyme